MKQKSNFFTRMHHEDLLGYWQTPTEGTIRTNEFQEWFLSGIRQCKVHPYVQTWHIVSGLECPVCKKTPLLEKTKLHIVYYWKQFCNWFKPKNPKINQTVIDRFCRFIKNEYFYPKNVRLNDLLELYKLLWSRYAHEQKDKQMLEDRLKESERCCESKQKIIDDLRSKLDDNNDRT